MQEFTFKVTETNFGSLTVEADSLEQAQDILYDAWLAGEAYWHNTDLSYEFEGEQPANTNK